MRLPTTIPAAAIALGAFAFAQPALAAPATVAVANHAFNADAVTVNAGDAVTWLCPQKINGRCFAATGRPPASSR